MRVLGIDPGTYKMGVGVVSTDGSTLRADYIDIVSPQAP